MNAQIRWGLIMATALFYHFHKINSVEATGNVWLTYFWPSLSSICFFLGVFLILCPKQLSKKDLKEPLRTIFFCYLGLVCAYTISTSLKTVWMPTMISILRSNSWIGKKLRTTRSGLIKKAVLHKTAYVFESRLLRNLQIAVVALLCLHYSLKFSGLYENIVPPPTAAYSKKVKFAPEVDSSFIALSRKQL